MPAQVPPSFVGGRWRDDDLPDPPDDSVVGTPLRRARSVRRTSHIDVRWAEGFGSPMSLHGHSRDLATPSDGEPTLIGDVGFAMDLARDPTITAMSIDPEPQMADDLVGTSAIKGFRARCADLLPPGPLRSLLDDVAVVTRIGSIAWFLPTLRVPLPEGLGPSSAEGGQARHQRTSSGAVVCSGLRPDGFEQLNRQRGIPFGHFVRRAGDLGATDDPWAWHRIEESAAVRMRRRRRIDVWREDTTIEVDAHYRDSVWGEDDLEYSVHEYSLLARVNGRSGRLTDIEAVAHVLPFPECPLAAEHATLVAGTQVETLRATVPSTITGLHACTHLNDMLRGLADVPALATGIQP